MTTPLPAAAAAMTKDEAVEVLLCAINNTLPDSLRSKALEAFAALRALTAPAGVPDGFVLAGWQVRECHPWDVRKPHAWSAWEQASEFILNRIRDEGPEFDGATRETREFYVAAAPPSDAPGEGEQEAPHWANVPELFDPSPAEQGAREDGDEIERKAAAMFADYFAKNYPGPNTIISDPNWHAPRIFRAALYAIMHATDTTPIATAPLAAGRVGVVSEASVYTLRSHLSLRFGVMIGEESARELLVTALSAAGPVVAGEVVTEAMVERACDALGGTSIKVSGHNAKLFRREMRRALTAALSTPESAKEAGRE